MIFRRLGARSIRWASFSLVVAAAASGCHHHGAAPPGTRNGPRLATQLLYPHNSSTQGVVAVRVSTRTVVSVGAMMVCTEGPRQPVRILSVQPNKGNGHVKVTAFATRPNPLEVHKVALGSLRQPLSQLGFHPDRPQFVSTHCRPSGTLNARKNGFDTSELAASFQRSGAATGDDQGVIVTYEDVSGARGKLIIPFEVTLCAPQDQTHECQ